MSNSRVQIQFNETNRDTNINTDINSQIPDADKALRSLELTTSVELLINNNDFNNDLTDLDLATAQESNKQENARGNEVTKEIETTKKPLGNYTLREIHALVIQVEPNQEYVAFFDTLANNRPFWIKCLSAIDEYYQLNQTENQPNIYQTPNIPYLKTLSVDQAQKIYGTSFEWTLKELSMTAFFSMTLSDLWEKAHAYTGKNKKDFRQIMTANYGITEIEFDDMLANYFYPEELPLILEVLCSLEKTAIKKVTNHEKILGDVYLQCDFSDHHIMDDFIYSEKISFEENVKVLSTNLTNYTLRELHETILYYKNQFDSSGEYTREEFARRLNLKESKSISEVLAMFSRVSGKKITFYGLKDISMKAAEVRYADVYNLAANTFSIPNFSQLTLEQVWGISRMSTTPSNFSRLLLIEDLFTITSTLALLSYDEEPLTFETLQTLSIKNLKDNFDIKMTMCKLREKMDLENSSYPTLQNVHQYIRDELEKKRKNSEKEKIPKKQVYNHFKMSAREFENFLGFFSKDIRGNNIVINFSTLTSTEPQALMEQLGNQYSLAPPKKDNSKKLKLEKRKFTKHAGIVIGTKRKRTSAIISSSTMTFFGNTHPSSHVTGAITTAANSITARKETASQSDATTPIVLTS